MALTLLDWSLTARLWHGCLKDLPFMKNICSLLILWKWWLLGRKIINRFGNNLLCILNKITTPIWNRMKSPNKVLIFWVIYLKTSQIKNNLQMLLAISSVISLLCKLFFIYLITIERGTSLYRIFLKYFRKLERII
jgi:hypothetical protein